MLMVMVGWADKWLAGAAGPPVLYRHHACGEISHVDLRCAHCGEPMHAGDIELLPGPGAGATPGHGPDHRGRLMAWAWSYSVPAWARR
jgi:hypothetical protein